MRQAWTIGWRLLVGGGSTRLEDRLSGVWSYAESSPANRRRMLIVLDVMLVMSILLVDALFALIAKMLR